MLKICTFVFNSSESLNIFVNHKYYTRKLPSNNATLLIIFRIACPLLLGIMIQYFMPGSRITKPDVFYYAGGLVLAVFLKNCCYHHYTMQTQLIGMRVRIACCSLLYRKVICLAY